MIIVASFANLTDAEAADVLKSIDVLIKRVRTGYVHLDFEPDPPKVQNPKEPRL